MPSALEATQALQWECGLCGVGGLTPLLLAFSSQWCPLPAASTIALANAVYRLTCWAPHPETLTGENTC